MALIINAEQCPQADSHFALEYEPEILSYLLSKETPVGHLFFKVQTDFSLSFRIKVIDWMTALSNQFEFEQETLHLAVAYFNKFLDLKTVGKERLQLLAIGCLFIASKYEEIYIPSITQFLLVCENAYTKEEVKKIENLILKTLGFNLGFPTSARFLTFNLASEPDEFTQEVSKFLLDLSLVNHELTSFEPSIIAKTVFYFAKNLTNQEVNQPTEGLENETHVSKECLLILKNLWKDKKKYACYEKYSEFINFSVILDVSTV